MANNMKLIDEVMIEKVVPLLTPELSLIRENDKYGLWFKGEGISTSNYATAAYVASQKIQELTGDCFIAPAELPKKCVIVWGENE